MLPSANVTRLSDVQEENRLGEPELASSSRPVISVSEAGSSIISSEVQPTKVVLGRTSMTEFAAKRTFFKDEQPLKVFSPMVFKVEGRKIVSKDQQPEKTLSPILVSPSERVTVSR